MSAGSSLVLRGWWGIGDGQGGLHCDRVLVAPSAVVSSGAAV